MENETFAVDVTDLDEYQAKAHSFNNKITNVSQLDSLTNAALGLTGESGEFADLIKKIVFHEHPFTEIEAQKLEKELGDVLWYIAQAATALKVNLSTIATGNIIKLTERHGGYKFNKEASIAKEAAKDNVRCGRCGRLMVEHGLLECSLPQSETVRDNFAGFTVREKKR